MTTIDHDPNAEWAMRLLRAQRRQDRNEVRDLLVECIASGIVTDSEISEITALLRKNREPKEGAR